jgi:outer membrane protein
MRNPAAAAGLALALVAAPHIALRAQDTTITRPVVPSGDSITLPQAIRIALEQDINVRTARNNVILDSLTVRQAHNQFNPNLAASTQTSQAFGSQNQNSFAMSGGLSSGLTLYNGRQNINTLRQAELNVRATGYDLGRTRQTVVFTVASDFLNLITQQDQLQVQQENLTAQEQELTQQEAFARAGTHPIGDLYQQQLAVASTRFAVATARHGTEIAKVDLIEELRLDPRGTYTFVPPTARIDSATLVTFNLDSLISVALAQRVDVSAQIFRVEAARRAILIAEGSRLPVVSASLGYSSGINSAASGDFLSQLNQRRGGSLGLSVSIPIFDRGAAEIAKERALVGLDNELLQLRDEQLRVALEVRRAYLDYQAAGEQLTEATAQSTAAALSLQSAQARYSNGLATFVEVTLARAALIQAQSAAVNARSSVAFQQALMSYYTGVIGPANARVNR